ncbi:MAG: NUDIX hydrolase [Candidatus Moranbacteria bacterium]|nr:NUDIX hydrolase [Candidatus Moranbacteria bacterium]
MDTRILKNELIACRDLQGRVVELPVEKFQPRVSAYGLIRQEDNYGKILFVRMKISGKYFLPGGGIELCEPIEDGLISEVREETGIDVEVEDLLGHLKTQFYDQEKDLAYDNISLYYKCKPLNFTLHFDENESVIPVWIPLLYTLKRWKFQYPLTGGFLEKLINRHMSLR